MNTSRTPKLEPLKISCTDTDCDADLHCFLQKKRRGPHSANGPCRDCGVDLVEWARVQARDIDDVQYTFDALRRERIRHEFWHRDFDESAVNYARRKGRRALEDDTIEKRIRSSVGRGDNHHEGRQTPYTGNVIYYAQHALACCCRRCIEYWHGIEPNRDLTDEEVAYLKALIQNYLRRRITWLRDEPEKIPRRNRTHE
ncbi:MAG: DUF4186 family protein [Myxococcales bacterium]|nr:DUF4186 family protein [Myxococcales bacterium]